MKLTIVTVLLLACIAITFAKPAPQFSSGKQRLVSTVN